MDINKHISFLYPGDSEKGAYQQSWEDNYEINNFFYKIFMEFEMNMTLERKTFSVARKIDMD